MVTGLLAACPPQAPLPLPGFRKLERRMEKLSSFPFRTPCSPWARPFTSPHCSRSCSLIPGLCPPTTPLTLEGPSPLSPDPHPPRPSGTHSWLSVPSAQTVSHAGRGLQHLHRAVRRSAQRVILFAARASLRALVCSCEVTASPALPETCFLVSAVLPSSSVLEKAHCCGAHCLSFFSGCARSSLLCSGSLQLWRAGAPLH